MQQDWSARRLDGATAAQARDAVRPLARRLDVAERLERYAPQAWTGGGPRLPALHLEDVSGIPFVSIVPGVEAYQHRARVRAGDGDLFAAMTPPAAGYEEYCRSLGRMGSPEFVQTDPGEGGYAVARACRSGSAFDRLTERAKQAGGFVIHPYMAIEEVWNLAADIAAAAGVPAHVIGPPPPSLWIANDKARLSEVVSCVLSPEWIVETHKATEPAEMAAHLLKLAQRHQKVGLKRTRCASATGNAVYDLATIQAMRSEEIVDEVRRFLHRTEWALDEEVLVVAWEQTDDSPSTQLWIPPEGQGAPVVDGVYEQLLEGEEKVFLGSRPSQLPEEVNRTLIDVSLRVATALQFLGYVGRCSFDFILLPDDDGCTAKFTECNGRWGGTSTPMFLVDRLVGGPRPHYRAQDYMHRDLTGVPFKEILARAGDGLYDPATGKGHYVFYNVGPLEVCGKFDVIALADSPEQAERCIKEDLPARLGL